MYAFEVKERALVLVEDIRRTARGDSPSTSHIKTKIAMSNKFTEAEYPFRPIYVEYMEGCDLEFGLLVNKAVCAVVVRGE